MDYLQLEVLVLLGENSEVHIVPLVLGLEREVTLGANMDGCWETGRCCTDIIYLIA
jgi:hypothetical protein